MDKWIWGFLEPSLLFFVGKTNWVFLSSNWSLHQVISEVGPLEVHNSPSKVSTRPLVSEGFVDSLLVHTQSWELGPSRVGDFVSPALDVGVDTSKVEAFPSDPPQLVILRRRKHNCVKPRGSSTRLVLGLDITMSQVLYMSSMIVVRNAQGRRFSVKTLKDWVDSHWVNYIRIFPWFINLLGDGLSSSSGMSKIPTISNLPGVSTQPLSSLKNGHPYLM
jgi:hypothetical protein